MNITNSKSINVNSADSSAIKNNSIQKDNNDAKFSDELKNISKNEKTIEDKNDKELKEPKTKEECKSAQKKIKTEDLQTENNQTENIKTENADKVDDNINEALNGLNDTLGELNRLSQKDELYTDVLKQNSQIDDNKKYEDSGLIDNNMNIQETPDKLNLQAGMNMNFDSNGQPFAEFVKQNNKKDALSASAKELAEEKSIMSTMEENIAIANKNMALDKTKTVENEHGVHKIDKKSNLVVDTVVSYDRVIMDKADVEFFANIVENDILNLNDIQGAEKSSRVSKALADLLAKSMNDNKPVRIDFDNNISVIIKIDRAGKISADFLPSSQVAEAYLKENLPLLRQRFDDSNIDYNELNQRQRKQDNQENRKKERKDE